MIRARYLVFGTILAIATFAGALTATPSRNVGGTGSAAGSVSTSPQSQLVRILTPAPSEILANNSSMVRFELTKTGFYHGDPNFLVQLDGADPVRTSNTSQTFTGLATGAHTVSIALVDANNTPIPGGTASVQFVVAPQESPAEAPSIAAQSSNNRTEPAGISSERDLGHNSAESHLPKAGSPLPLISVIGFGILVGGIVSAMKTRS